MLCWQGLESNCLLLTLRHVLVTMCTETVVTICTASLTFHNSTFCPHSVFMCFVWISEQTAIISLYNINLLVCITETECVYCAVRIGSLNITQASSCLKIGFPLSVSFSPILYTHLQWRAVLTSSTNGGSLGTFHEAMFFRKQASIAVETIFTLILCPENFNGKRKKRGLEGLRPLRHGCPMFSWQKTKTVIADWSASRTCTDRNARYTPRPELLCSSIRGLYEIYKNVAMGQVKHPRGSQFGHPYFVDWDRSGRKTSNCSGALVWGWKSSGSGETPVSGFCAHCNEC